LNGCLNGPMTDAMHEDWCNPNRRAM